jgi:peptide/nickel transport system ATP-binding protein
MKIVYLKNLSLFVEREKKNILKDVSLSVQEKEILGVVGESGSGKTMLMRFLLGVVPKNLGLSFDLFSFLEKGISAKDARNVRSNIAMILQDPKTSLNPVLTVESQIKEAFLLRGEKGDLVEKVHQALKEVSIQDPERVAKSYPFELSGGMGQRVMIAMMLALKPKLLIADEPTSSLDAHVQKQILDLLKEKAEKNGMTLIIVSHDLSLVSSYCHRVIVMYQGQIVDSCVAKDLSKSKHPYTKGLLECLPKLNDQRKRLSVLNREEINL